jgi:hypothetical protein
MDIKNWLEGARADADRRGLSELKPLLETLARSTAALREQDRAAREADGGTVAPDGEAR